MSLPDVVRSFTSRAGVVRVQNALNGILWGCAVATPISFTFATILRADPILRYGFSALGALPVLTLVIAYIYFMIRDPNRLQSEEHIERQRELLLLERRGHSPVPPSLEISEDTAEASKIDEEKS